MKQLKNPTKAASAPRKPLDPQQFPSSPQADATAAREKVREVAHRANAPRQSKPREERRSKSQTGT
jgi:hypothetical protein